MKPSGNPDRVDKLWEVIDTRRQGYVDFNGLRKGLRKMDHRERFNFPVIYCLLAPARVPLLVAARIVTDSY
jgi:acetyl-CoA carboxylase alpha subunit